MTDQESYDKLHVWFSNIHTSAGEKVVKYLVANKVDLVEDRKITQEEGEKIAKQYNMNYFETSAKTKVNVTKEFESIIGEALEMKKKAVKNPSVMLNNEDKTAKKKKCC